jgi:hypothetical protein
MICLEGTGSPSRGAPAQDAQRFSRALLALLAAATIAVAPISTAAIGSAGSGDTAHSSPVYLLAQANHDIGHNEWAFQGGVAGRLSWVLSYAGLAVFWLAVALWMRWRSARIPGAGGRLWLRVLAAAWGAQLLAGMLTLSVALYADRTSTSLGPAVLRLVDVCSPWWSGVAALALVAVAERSVVAKWAAGGYGALLAVLLLVPLPGPDTVKVLALALVPAVAALVDWPGPQGSGARQCGPQGQGSGSQAGAVSSDAVAAG